MLYSDIFRPTKTRGKIEDVERFMNDLGCSQTYLVSIILSNAVPSFVTIWNLNICVEFYFITDPLICSICSALCYQRFLIKNLTHLPLLKFNIFKFLTGMLNVGSNKIIKGICFNCSSKDSYSFIFSKLRTYFSNFPQNSRQNREMSIL